MRRFLAAIALFLCSASSAPHDAAILLAVRTYADKRADGTVEKRSYIDPIGFVRRAEGRRVDFQRCPDRKCDSTQRAAKDIIDRYYRVGARYRVYRGGVLDGFITVLASDHGPCDEISRRAADSSDVALDSHWRAANGIATGSLELRPHDRPRRAPTPAELRELRELAARAFQLKAVDASAMTSMEYTNLAAADLDGDGHADIIGSAEVRDDDWWHQLFLVAMWDRSGRYRLDVIWYNRYPVATEPINAARSWTLVDYEDFDEDGVDEIIVEEHGYEWSSYKILKRHHEGTWDVVYEGGGSGC